MRAVCISHQVLLRLSVTHEVVSGADVLLCVDGRHISCHLIRLVVRVCAYKVVITRPCFGCGLGQDLREAHQRVLSF